MWLEWFLLARVDIYEVSDTRRYGNGDRGAPARSTVYASVIRSRLTLDQPVRAGEVLVELDAASQELQLQEKRTQLAAFDPRLKSLENEIAAEEKTFDDGQRGRTPGLEEARAHLR